MKEGKERGKFPTGIHLDLLVQGGTQKTGAHVSQGCWGIRDFKGHAAL